MLKKRDIIKWGVVLIVLVSILISLVNTLNIEDYFKSEAERKNESALNVKVGGVEYDTYQYGEALKRFDRAIELDPNNAEAWNDRGLTLKQLGRTDEALQSYDRAIKINESYIASWFNKGALLHEMNRSKEGFYVFDKFLELDPNHKYSGNVWNNKAMNLIELEKYDEALIANEMALKNINKMIPEIFNESIYPSFYLTRGVILMGLENYSGAVEYFDRAHKMNHTGTWMLEQRAIALNYLNNTTQAH